MTRGLGNEDNPGLLPISDGAGGIGLGQAFLVGSRKGVAVQVWVTSPLLCGHLCCTDITNKVCLPY